MVLGPKADVNAWKTISDYFIYKNHARISLSHAIKRHNLTDTSHIHSLAINEFPKRKSSKVKKIIA